jgi:phosphocarrier protein HPr
MSPAASSAANNELSAHDLSALREILIINKRGLHARASAKFVQTVEGSMRRSTVSKDGMTVGGTSIMGLMMLAASPGSSVLSPPAATRRHRRSTRWIS